MIPFIGKDVFSRFLYKTFKKAVRVGEVQVGPVPYKPPVLEEKDLSTKASIQRSYGDTPADSRLDLGRKLDAGRKTLGKHLRKLGLRHPNILVEGVKIKKEVEGKIKEAIFSYKVEPTQGRKFYAGVKLSEKKIDILKSVFNEDKKEYPLTVEGLKQLHKKVSREAQLVFYDPKINKYTQIKTDNIKTAVSKLREKGFYVLSRIALDMDHQPVYEVMCTPNELEEVKEILNNKSARSGDDATEKMEIRDRLRQNLKKKPKPDYVDEDPQNRQEIDTKIQDFRTARVIQKVNKKTNRKEYALVSKSNSSKVLKWFGPNKPSAAAVAKEEARVERFRKRGQISSESSQVSLRKDIIQPKVKFRSPEEQELYREGAELVRNFIEDVSTMAVAREIMTEDWFKEHLTGGERGLGLSERQVDKIARALVDYVRNIDEEERQSLERSRKVPERFGRKEQFLDSDITLTKKGKVLDYNDYLVTPEDLKAVSDEIKTGGIKKGDIVDKYIVSDIEGDEVELRQLSSVAKKRIVAAWNKKKISTAEATKRLAQRTEEFSEAINDFEE